MEPLAQFEIGERDWWLRVLRAGYYVWWTIAFGSIFVIISIESIQPNRVLLFLWVGVMLMVLLGGFTVAMYVKNEM